MITFLCSDINAHGGAKNREWQLICRASVLETLEREGNMFGSNTLFRRLETLEKEGNMFCVKYTLSQSHRAPSRFYS